MLSAVGVSIDNIVNDLILFLITLGLCHMHSAADTYIVDNVFIQDLRTFY